MKTGRIKMFIIPTILVIVFIGSAMSNPPLDNLDDDQKAMLNMLHDSCIDDSHADEGIIDKARKGDFTDDEKLKVYMSCIFQQLGALDDDGSVDVDTMINMLPESMQERGGKMIGSCRSVTGSSASDTAFKLNQCFYKADPSYFFLI